MHNRKLHTVPLTALVALIVFAACASNNCPLNNVVTCNYYFYDSEGNALSETEPFSVRSLLPGVKTVYVYRKAGVSSVTLDEPDSTYLENGYTQTVTTTRRDTLLVNQTSSHSYVQLPMRYFGTADTLIFDYTNISHNDTIIVTHESYAHVDLPECGTHYFHHLRSITATDAAIDRIEIVNPQVDFNQQENIQIFFNGTVN